MTYRKQLSTTTRITKLQETITESKELNFDKILIRKYCIELSQLQAQQRADRKKAERLKRVLGSTKALQSDTSNLSIHCAQSSNQEPKQYAVLTEDKEGKPLIVITENKTLAENIREQYKEQKIQERKSRILESMQFARKNKGRVWQDD